MSTATPPSPAAPALGQGRGHGRRALDGLLALVAHGAVGAAWGLTTLAVMGSLDVGRRMVMNSEFAFDTGRLPQPWVIPLGLLGVWLAHRFFRWSMARAGGGRPAWDARVIAWCGVLLGVLLGAYLWTPALQVGVLVGPASGQSTPWGALGWAAHYARLAVPAAVGLITAAMLLLSRHSPLVVAWRAVNRRVRGLRASTASRSAR